jgi:hypothetical protein
MTSTVVMPRRVQRQVGQPLPAGAVFVGTPSKWSNPFRIGVMKAFVNDDDPDDLVVFTPRSPAEVIEAFRWLVSQPRHAETIRAELAGKNLACWCPPDQPCSVDVLLDIANGAPGKAPPWRDPMTFAPPPAQRTTVVHIREQHDVRIGRPGPWGNPFIIGRDGNRAQVIAKYRDWIQTQPELLSQLPELRGKRLACFCSPLACHGDVLAELADAL